MFTKNKDTIILGHELTTDSIIVYPSLKKRKVSVDLSRYNIQLPPNGVIVVFEILSPSYYPADSIWYNGNKFIKTPGIDMIQTKNYWQSDHDRKNRTSQYSMVGPPVDDWISGSENWFVYTEGNDFAISITVQVGINSIM